ncbi:MAG: PAS domain-containing protein [Pseudomonadota bacterium]
MHRRGEDRRASGITPERRVQEILGLYGLSLAIDGSGDPRTICDQFLVSLVSRLSLSYAAVWIREPTQPAPEAEYILFASFPLARDGLKRLPADHPLVRRASSRQVQVVRSGTSEFEEVAVEELGAQGIQVIYPIGKVGWLKLYSTDADTLPDEWIHRLQAVIDRFSDTLRGALAQRQLQREVAQRTAVEGQLVEARSLTQTYADASPDLIFHKDTRGRFITANQAFVDYWQLDRPLPGLRARDFLPEPVAGITEAQDQMVMRSNQVARFHVAVNRPDGVPATLEVTRAPVTDTDGEVTGVIGISRDISARLEARSDLEIRDRALAATADGVVIARVDTNDLAIEYMNASVERITGYRQEEMLGKTMTALEWGNTDSDVKRLILRSIESRRACRTRLTNRRPDGTQYSADLAMDPIKGSDGTTSHYVCVLKDVTHQERLEREMLQRQKMDALARLTGGVAHDFNNMLATIMGFAELAHHGLKSKPDTQLQEYVDAIRLAAENGRELVSQLLTVSRKVPRSETEVVDVDQSVSLAIRMVRPLLPPEVSLDYECGQSDLRVALDPVNLERILVNLCLNARDAMHGRGQIRITVSKRQVADLECAASLRRITGEYVALTVEDAGPGISAEIRHRVFEPFFTTKSESQGTGMGLAVVQGIVKAHLGAILVERSHHEGAAVTILLPPAEEMVVQPSETEAAPTPVPASTGIENKSIMVVDDDRQVAALLRELLRYSGANVNLFHTGQSAFEYFTEHAESVDLLLTDQTMPGMTGVELIERVRGLRPELPCVMLTAYSDFADDQSAANLGIDRLLHKPIDNQTLLRGISDVFARLLKQPG